MKVTRSVITCLVVATAACGGSDLAEHRAEVEEAGRVVMPFDLERTTHFFESLETGGLQTIIADDSDPEQVALIRAHLAEEAGRFASGDFHDPAMIHGDDMAGLHALVTGYEGLTISYRDITQGAEIEYVSRDPVLVEALHLWFEAQLRDHGEHAQSHR